MGHNRIRRFFENLDRFAEVFHPSSASEERAAPTRAAGGESQSASSPEPRPEAIGTLPCAAARDVARPLAQGWCNYSI
jgi:hypothetical protein